MKYKDFGITILLLKIICGCAAVMPVALVSAVALGVTQSVNLARKQYPDINFDLRAPFENAYDSNYMHVWDQVIGTLEDMDMKLSVANRRGGFIKTSSKNMNEVSWVGKSLGKASFQYKYVIIVRKKHNAILVKTKVQFWEDRVYLSLRKKNIPEASNMMRHIFFRNLNKKVAPMKITLPTNLNQSKNSNNKTKPADVHKPSKRPSVQSMDVNSQNDNIIKLKRDADAVTIRKLQIKLLTIGYQPGVADGLIGPKTSMAIKAFQRDHGLKVNGILDNETIQALYKFYPE